MTTPSDPLALLRSKSYVALLVLAAPTGAEFGWVDNPDILAPFCQAAAPAVAADLACANLIFACSPGGTSISRIHRRVAENICAPPMAKPAMAIRAPIATSEPPVISGPELNAGKLPFGVVLADMTPIPPPFLIGF
jgi:hypothetical protein